MKNSRIKEKKCELCVSPVFKNNLCGIHFQKSKSKKTRVEDKSLPVWSPVFKKKKEFGRIKLSH